MPIMRPCANALKTRLCGFARGSSNALLSPVVARVNTAAEAEDWSLAELQTDAIDAGRKL